MPLKADAFNPPALAPEKLLRIMLLEVFYSIRSERQLIEHTQNHLRSFAGSFVLRKTIRCGY